MIIQIPTNHNSRYLANIAYKAYEDLKKGSITKAVAYRNFDLFCEISDRLIKRETPTRERGNPAGV